MTSDFNEPDAAYPPGIEDVETELTALKMFEIYEYDDDVQEVQDTVRVPMDASFHSNQLVVALEDVQDSASVEFVTDLIKCCMPPTSSFDSLEQQPHIEKIEGGELDLHRYFSPSQLDGRHTTNHSYSGYRLDFKTHESAVEALLAINNSNNSPQSPKIFVALLPANTRTEPFPAPSPSIILTSAHATISTPSEMTVIGEILFLFTAPLAVIFLILVECFYFSIGLRHLQDLERYLFGDVRNTFILLWTGISVRVQNAEMRLKEAEERYEKQEKVLIGHLWCASIREKQLGERIRASVLTLKEVFQISLALNKTLWDASTVNRETERAQWEAKLKKVTEKMEAWKAQRDLELTNWEKDVQKQTQKVLNLRAENSALEERATKAESEAAALRQEEERVRKMRHDLDLEIAKHEVLFQEMLDESRVQRMCEPSILDLPLDLPATTE